MQYYKFLEIFSKILFYSSFYVPIIIIFYMLYEEKMADVFKREKKLNVFIGIAASVFIFTFGYYQGGKLMSISIHTYMADNPPTLYSACGTFQYIQFEGKNRDKSYKIRPERYTAGKYIIDLDNGISTYSYVWDLSNPQDFVGIQQGDRICIKYYYHLKDSNDNAVKKPLIYSIHKP